MGKRVIESDDEVRQWHEKGLTFAQMSDRHAELYGRRPAPTAFSNLVGRRGWKRRNHRATDLLPWTIRNKEHRWQYVAQMLRLESKRRAGRELNPDRARDLDAWLRSRAQDGLVVDYCEEAGFRLVEPRPGVDVDLIREPV